MYEHLIGKLIEKNPAYAIIECGGVGYYINISLTTYSSLKDKENCKLLIHLIVREDAMTLYGFADDKEREIFRQLLSVNGVGANTARMILSSYSPDDIYQAIINGDVPKLKSIKGIGQKSAQRIIIDLKDKLPKGIASKDISLPEQNSSKEEALSALATLGFARSVAEKAVDKVLKADGSDISVAGLIRKTLQSL